MTVGRRLECPLRQFICDIQSSTYSGNIESTKKADYILEISEIGVFLLRTLDWQINEANYIIIKDDVQVGYPVYSIFKA